MGYFLPNEHYMNNLHSATSPKSSIDDMKDKYRRTGLRNEPMHASYQKGPTVVYVREAAFGAKDSIARVLLSYKGNPALQADYKPLQK
jgi:hypothetical protein